MDVTYGNGQCVVDGKTFHGRLILGDVKLFLRSMEGEDVPSSFIPVDRIEWLKKTSDGFIVQIRQTLSIQYHAQYIVEGPFLNDLIQELVKRCGLKKRFFKNEWVQDSL